MTKDQTFEELNNLHGIKFYKVIAGGSSLRKYVAQSKRDCESLQQSDWRALYTQFQRNHTLGTVPYRWERNEDIREAVLVEATVRSPLNILVVDGPLWHHSAVSGADKATAIKKQQGIQPEKSLMDELGAAGKAVLIRETEDEWELVFGHDFFLSLSVQEKVVARFQRHAKLPVTVRWALGDSGEWNRWEDGHELADIPDLDMKWLRLPSDE